jgi:alpha-glucosidase
MLGSIKEKFVRVWTNNIIHLGNTTTNRVEPSHARLKKYLKNSLGDICENWEQTDNMFSNMFVELQKNFQSIIFRDVTLLTVMWYEL